MSSFTAPLVLEKLPQKGRCYRVPRAFSYHLGSEWGTERVDIEEGSLTDLGSIPWLFRWLVDPAGTSVQAFVVHDDLYKGGWITWTYTIQSNDPSQPLQTVEAVRYPTRKEADEILLEAMGVLQENAAIKRIVYAGLRMGGHWAWHGRA